MFSINCLTCKCSFKRPKNVPVLYHWLHYDDSSDDLLLNETIFTTKSMAILFKTMVKHTFRQYCTLDSTEQEASSCCINFNTAKEKIYRKS